VSGRGPLLLLTPVTPAEGGNGLAMRAGVFLEGLARSHDVRVLVAPVLGPAAAPGPLVARCAAGFEVLARAPAGGITALTASLSTPAGRARALAHQGLPRLARRAPPSWGEAVVEAARDCAIVQVQRVYLAPLVEAIMRRSRRPALVLDLDDVESDVRREAAGDDLDEQLRYERLEAEFLPRFDMVCVAAADDLQVLRRRHHGLAVECVPNAVRMPPPAAIAAHDRGAAAGRELVMVGNFSYAPNVEGARWFVERVLPLLEPTPSLQLVGSSPTPELLALAERPGVAVRADVRDLTPWYLRSRLALAPLLRGGGTRIKVLEALAHGRPVVATPVGARGLGRELAAGPEHDAPVLVASSPQEFAAGCARLLDDGDRADRLGRAGRSLVEGAFSLEPVAALVDRLVRRNIAAR
jgi:glycosyltransferase involved in cell wall biosynthesis